MKYLVTQGENTFPAAVLLLANSKKEMDEMIAKKRTSSAPLHLLQSAPEDVNSDNEKSNLKRSKSSLITQDNSKLEKILTKKLKKYNSEITLTNHAEAEKFRNACQTRKAEGSSEVASSSECISEEEQPEDYVRSCKIKKLQSIENDQANNTTINNESVTYHQNKSNTKPVITTVSQVHLLTTCKADFDKLKSNNVTLKEENCTFKDKIKELKEENEKLRNNKSHLKKKLEEKICELNKIQKLNENLQIKIIEKFEERNAMVDKQHVRDSILYEDNYPPIGTLRTSDNFRRIHIGRDQWIHETGFNTLLNTAKSPRQCASSILTLVFDLEVLMTSTISGFESNKKRLGKTACPKLDAIKFGACEDFYIYWMKNTYKPRKDEKKNYLSELNKFDYYAGKKIAELKRDREKSDKKSNKRLSKSKQFSKSDENLNNDKHKINIDTRANTSLAELHENVEENLCAVDQKIAENTKNVETMSDIYDWSPNTTNSIPLSDIEENLLEDT